MSSDELIAELAAYRPADNHVMAACHFCGAISGHWTTDARGVRRWTDGAEIPALHKESCLWRRASEYTRGKS